MTSPPRDVKKHFFFWRRHHLGNVCRTLEAIRSKSEKKSRWKCETNRLLRSRRWHTKNRDLGLHRITGALRTSLTDRCCLREAPWGTVAPAGMTERYGRRRRILCSLEFVCSLCTRCVMSFFGTIKWNPKEYCSIERIRTRD